MNISEKDMRALLVEAILEYIEEKRTFRSVVRIGVEFHAEERTFQNKYLEEVVVQLASMADAILAGQKFSRETLFEIFTNMLEKLLRD